MLMPLLTILKQQRLKRCLMPQDLRLHVNPHVPRTSHLLHRGRPQRQLNHHQSPTQLLHLNLLIWMSKPRQSRMRSTLSVTPSSLPHRLLRLCQRIRLRLLQLHRQSLLPSLLQSTTQSNQHRPARNSVSVITPTAIERPSWHKHSRLVQMPLHPWPHRNPQAHQHYQPPVFQTQTLHHPKLWNLPWRL
jgi:hypothetical protein